MKQVELLQIFVGCAVNNMQTFNTLSTQTITDAITQAQERIAEWMFYWSKCSTLSFSGGCDCL
jgi:hypothetical protein